MVVTSQVTTMGYMFNGCNGLTSLDLRSFNTSQVTSMAGMFRGCSKLTQINVSDKWVMKSSQFLMFDDCGTNHVTVV